MHFVILFLNNSIKNITFFKSSLLRNADAKIPDNTEFALIKKRLVRINRTFGIYARFIDFQSRQKIQVRGQLQTPATLPPGQ
jgi:hypothetical protein